MNNLLMKRQKVERVLRRSAGTDAAQLEELIADKAYYDKEIEKLKGMIN